MRTVFMTSLILIMLATVASCANSDPPALATVTVAPTDSATLEPTVESQVLEPTHNTLIQACSGLSMFLSTIGTGEQAAPVSQTDIFLEAAEESANVKIWNIESPGGAMYLLDERVHLSIGRVWVVDDVSEEGDEFTPIVLNDLAESFGIESNAGANSDGENTVFCMLRDLFSVEKCDYSFLPAFVQEEGSPSSEVDSWQPLVHLFAVGLETYQIAFVGTLTGGKAGCPEEIELGEKIIGPAVDTEQIAEAWNEFRAIEINAESDAQVQYGQQLEMLLYGRQSQYLLMLGTDNIGEPSRYVLVDPKDWGSVVRVSLADGDQFTNIVLQEVEILDTSIWQQHENDTAIMYTLENDAQYGDLIGVHFQPVGEQVLLMQDGVHVQAPELGFAKAKEVPDILLIAADE